MTISHRVATIGISFVLFLHIIFGSPLNAISGSSQDADAIISSKESKAISNQLQEQGQLEEALKELNDSINSREAHPLCPLPFQRIAKYCLHFYTSVNKLDWESLRKYCWSLDADLGYFSNENDLILAMAYLDIISVKRFWIGGHRYNSSSDFLWLDGSKLPNTSSPLWNYQEREGYNCVALKRNDSNLSHKLVNYQCQDRDYGYWGAMCKLL